MLSEGRSQLQRLVNWRKVRVSCKIYMHVHVAIEVAISAAIYMHAHISYTYTFMLRL